MFQYLADEGYGVPHRRHARQGPGRRLRGRRRLGLRRADRPARRLGRRQGVDEPGRPRQLVEEADGAVRARAAGNGAPRSAGLPPEPHRGLARPPARRPRAARLRPGHDAADRRARVPAGPRCRTRSCSSRSWPARSRSPATSTGGRRRCTPCSTRCSPRRAFPSRASAGRRTGADGHDAAVYVVGTLDTKGAELEYLARPSSRDAGVGDDLRRRRARRVTTGRHRRGDQTCPRRGGRASSRRRRARCSPATAGVVGRGDVGGADEIRAVAHRPGRHHRRRRLGRHRARSRRPCAPWPSACPR